MEFFPHVLCIFVLLTVQRASFIDDMGIGELDAFVIDTNQLTSIDVDTTEQFHILADKSEKAFFFDFNNVFQNLHFKSPLKSNGFGLV